MVHVTPGLNGVSRAVNEAERGLLPAEATIVVGQPCAVDPSRAPAGKSVIWIQLQELPQQADRRRARRDRSRRRHLDRDAARGLRGSHRRPPRHADREPAERDDQARRALARRPRGPQLQPRRRRHLLGLVRARPEPAVAADRAAARATPLRSRASGTSAPPRTRAPASAPAPATSSRSTCCSLRWAAACSIAAPAPPRSCAGASCCDAAAAARSLIAQS